MRTVASALALAILGTLQLFADAALGAEPAKPRAAQAAKPATQGAKPDAKGTQLEAASESKPDSAGQGPAIPFAVEVSRIELRPRRGAKPMIRLAPIALPYALAEQSFNVGLDAQPVGVESEKWPIEVVFLSDSKHTLSILHGKQAAKLDEGRASMKIPLTSGKNSVRVTVVDLRGQSAEFDLMAEVGLRPLEEVEKAADPTTFLVLGAAFFSRSISREGSALLAQTNDSAITTGIRGIYRRRLFKSFTDRLPGDFKLFGDASGTFGVTVSGSEEAKGFPVWLDGRMTLEFYEYKSFRLEAGAGLTFFAPNLSSPAGGTPSSYLGVVLSTRVGYPITPGLFMLGGFNFALPDSDLTESDLLVSNPIETFLAVSLPRGNRGFWEIRLKYFNISTSGTIVKSGQFDRSESFIGAEILFGWIK